MAKSPFDMPWAEWRSLAGLADPYAIVSAEAGVPKSMSISMTEGVIVEDHTLDESQFSGGSAKPDSGPRKKAARLVKLKRRHAQMKQGEDPLKSPAKDRHADSVALYKYLRRQGKVEDVSYNTAFAAYLGENGIAIGDFHALMNEAIESGDEEMMDELLALEVQFDELVQNTIKRGAQLGKQAMAKVVGAPAPVPTAQAPVPSAQAPKPTAQAAVPTAQAPKPTAQAAPAQAQPQGAAQAPSAQPAVQPQKAMKPQPGLPKIKKPAAPPVKPKPVVASVEAAWGEFLAESDITLDQFHILMDEAMETGDAEVVDELLALEDSFGVWLEKRTKEQQRAGREAVWKQQGAKGMSRDQLTRASTASSQVRKRGGGSDAQWKAGQSAHHRAVTGPAKPQGSKAREMWKKLKPHVQKAKAQDPNFKLFDKPGDKPVAKPDSGGWGATAKAAQAAEAGRTKKTAATRAKMKAAQPQGPAARTKAGEISAKPAAGSSPGVNGSPKVVVSPQARTAPGTAPSAAPPGTAPSSTAPGTARSSTQKRGAPPQRTMSGPPAPSPSTAPATPSTQTAPPAQGTAPPPPTAQPQAQDGGDTDGAAKTAKKGVAVKKKAQPKIPAVRGWDRIKFGAGKTLGGVSRTPKGAVQTARSVLSASVDDFWDDFLSEHDITLEQLHCLMDEAMETGSQEDINTLLDLEEVFGMWLEKRDKAQQYHGMMMQNPEPGQAQRWRHHYRGDAKKLAKSLKVHNKPDEPRRAGVKKLRSYGSKHNPSAGDSVADWRKEIRKGKEDPLAKKAAMSPRERRSAQRAKARGYGR